MVESMCCDAEKKVGSAVQQRDCVVCGNPIPLAAVWCTHCEMFQPDARDTTNGRTQQCPHCGFHVPRDAKVCYKCARDIHGSNWYKMSLPTAGALTGLLAALTLLLGAAGTFYDKRIKTKSESQTDVLITRIDSNTREIDISAQNPGDRDANIYAFQLSVSILNKKKRITELVERFTLDSAGRSSMALTNTKHAELHELHPAGLAHRWNLAASLDRVKPSLAEDLKNLINTQLFEENSPLSAQCELQYIVQESSATAAEVRSLSKGIEQLTQESCDHFLRNAYNGPKE